jgi:hypothetical protein
MEPYLNSFRLDEKVYYLNKEGRERIGCERILKKTHQVEHFLMRNQLYIACGCPATWKNEVKLMVPNEVSVIADAVFVTAGAYNIVEIDNTQKMCANRSKVEKYRKLLELGVFDKSPKFIWMTKTEHRKKQLLKLCEGLRVTVYLASDFH